MNKWILYGLTFLGVGAVVTAIAVPVGADAPRRKTILTRSLLDKPTAVGILPEKSLADLSSVEADFRG